jgi:hypothetical protein
MCPTTPPINHILNQESSSLQSGHIRRRSAQVLIEIIPRGILPALRVSNFWFKKTGILDRQRWFCVLEVFNSTDFDWEIVLFKWGVFRGALQNHPCLQGSRLLRTALHFYDRGYVIWNGVLDHRVWAGAVCIFILWMS